jgi:hypothetical protein
MRNFMHTHTDYRLPYGIDRNLPDVETDQNLQSTIMAWLADTELALQLVDAERKRSLHFESARRPIRRLAELAFIAGLSGGDTGKRNAYLFGRTLTAVATEHMARIDSQDEMWIIDSISNCRDELYLDNRAAPGIEQVYSPTWVDTQRRELPPFMWHGLSSLRLTPEFLMTDTDGTERMTGGIYSPHGSRTTRARGIELYYTVADRVAAHPDSEPADKLMSQWLIHEITHFAHYNRIPLQWLRRWVGLCRWASTEISEYATFTAQQKGQAAGIREDLCDSTAMFVYEPAMLLLKSPERAQLLNELTGRYSPEQVQKYDRKARIALESPLLRGMINTHFLEDAKARQDAAKLGRPLT